MVDDKVVSVTYTKKIVNSAVLSFVWTRGVVNKKILWIVETVILIILIALFLNDVRDWQIMLMAALILLPPGFLIALWYAHYRNTVGKFNRMLNPQAIFIFHDDGFEIESELGSVTIYWSGICEIWERPGYWMIFIAENQFITLPMATISPTLQMILRSKCF